jgi:preprotein translocase subunit SecB
MAESNDGGPAGNGPSGAAGGQPGQPQVGVLSQYVKDLSFENPGAPWPGGGPQGQPAINIAVDVQARRLNDENFEVELRISAEAKAQDQAVFMAEVLYGGLFLLRNVPQESLEPFLLIEGPRLLFPFVRRVLADLTRDGGFPPLMVEPIDFAQLYRQRLAQQGGAAGTAQA